ncbi:MAG: hypothetical protein QOH05_1453, partial [Acetobacteraceae bacterium]|nr:hypothetical protein [Acetobacteraceae bacterium]
SLVRALGATVVLSVQNSLRDLLLRMDPDVTVIGENETPAAFDYQCPLMSLPLAFGTTLATIPSVPRYLWPDEQRRRHWDARLSPRTRPRIGIAWRGNPNHQNDRDRSFGLACFLSLLSDDIQWICLYHAIGETEADLLRRDGRIAYFGDELEGFAETSALFACLDLVVTVDTSFAHLAGAMGIPVWILLSHAADWRWLLDRPDTPWYPGARLFRQPAAGDWATVIEEVRHELRLFSARP